MSIFLKQFKTKQIFDAYKVLITYQARQAHFFPEFKPGPYPRTQKEREAAAKKYNLLPEEYEPYPENENPVGDYPKLPFESVDSKNPYHPWDMKEIRKDFCEPVPREIMMLLPEAISTRKKEFTAVQQVLIYFSTIAAVILLILLTQKLELVLPLCEKQYPTPGVTHYTFDHLSEEEMKKVLAEEHYQKCLKKCKKDKMIND